MKMTTNFDGLQLPEGEVKALIDGEWKSVMFTDDVSEEEMNYLEEHWPTATKFRFEYCGCTWEWDNEKIPA